MFWCFSTMKWIFMLMYVSLKLISLVFDHVHDVPVEVVDFNPCFDQSNIINSALSIDRVRIPASSIFYYCTILNALLDYESDAHDDRYAVFYDVKVDMADFENACRGGCEICEEINAAICSVLRIPEWNVTRVLPSHTLTEK
ncbi:hypothetical protein V8G54_035592 [Vigna mungo]|uniref:Uncharacterized protein n=1 Tax=Vigna mungo TaxID=3915 RepID=A0AAQ3RB67_VIGMU